MWSDNVKVPVPASVVLPAMSMNVLLPTLFSLIVPLLVIVPAPRFTALLSRTFTVLPLEIVSVVSVVPPNACIRPPEAVLSVPPVTLTAFRFTTELVPEARIVPPVLVMGSV